MKFLNKKKTKLVRALIEKAGNNAHIRIENPPYNPLHVELVSDNEILTAEGIGLKYCIAHYFRYSGELIGSPEICFIVFNLDKKRSMGKPVRVAPYRLFMPSGGLAERCIQFHNNTILSINRPLQKELIRFASKWLKYVSKQGFLAKGNKVIKL